MSKQKLPQDNSLVEIQAPKVERDYGPPPKDMQVPEMVATIPPEPTKAAPRRMKPNLKILAQIDSLLEKADAERPNGSWLILQYLVGDRGLELREIHEVH